MVFTPNFRISPASAQAMMAIEYSRAAVERLPVSPHLIASLSESAWLLSSHHLMHIEGNRLTLLEAKKVVPGLPISPGDGKDQGAEAVWGRSLGRLLEGDRGIRPRGSPSGLEARHPWALVDGDPVAPPGLDILIGCELISEKPEGCHWDEASR